MTTKYRRYHFSLGNSGTGPIGYCAEIFARSPEEAVEVLGEQVLEDAKLCNPDSDSADHRVGYINAYTNPSAITVDDIDEVDELTDDEHAELLELLDQSEDEGENDTPQEMGWVGKDGLP